jgi:GDP-L-fucose synthase
VVEKLKERGASDIIIPKIEEYNLVDPQAIRRLFDNVTAGGSNSGLTNLITIHLAAQVGGINANRDHLAEFFL